MSIKLMSAVFDSALPTGQKFVALMYADRGNDDGSRIFPAQRYVAWATGYSPKHVGRLTDKLLAIGVLEFVCYRGRGVKEFRMNPDKLPARPPYIGGRNEDEMGEIRSDISSPNDGQIGHLVPQIGHSEIQIGHSLDTEPSIEPSIEPSVDLNEFWRVYGEMLDTWVKLFPKKPAPRQNNKTLQGKLRTRLKNAHFRDNWRTALERASDSQFLKDSRWFDLFWFLRNDDHYERCLNGNYDNDRPLGARPKTKPPAKQTSGVKSVW